MTSILTFKPKDAEKLQGIPGLHLHGLHATGSKDALAAGQFVLTGKRSQVLTPRQCCIKVEGARPYQDIGVNWMNDTVTAEGGCILSDEMGLGKTFQTISLLKERMTGRALILCPGSVRETWRDELIKWGYKDAEISILYPNEASWRDCDAATIVVCSHDYRMIERAMTLAFGGETPEYLVIDEAHRFRGRKNRRVDVMGDTAALIPYKIALTGSPQWNTMKDWYSLLKILFAHRFGNQYDFDRRYAGAKQGQFGGLEYPKKDDAKITPKMLNSEELKLRLQYVMLGRTKAQVAADMPPMSINMRWVDVTPEAKKARQKVHMGGRQTGSPVHDAIVATLKGKVDEVMALAAEAGRFVLTTWTNAGASDLHRLLNEAGTPCILATASMSGPKRSAAIHEAISKRCGLVATTDLFAEGLNLQKVASVGILHGIDYVPEKMRQLMARLHRIDIVDPVVWHVIAMRESIDVDIINAGVFKMDNQILASGKKSDLRGAFKDDKAEALSERQALANLYALMESEDHDSNED